MERGTTPRCPNMAWTRRTSGPVNRYKSIFGRFRVEEFLLVEAARLLPMQRVLLALL